MSKRKSNEEYKLENLTKDELKQLEEDMEDFFTGNYSNVEDDVLNEDITMSHLNQNASYQAIQRKIKDIRGQISRNHLSYSLQFYHGLITKIDLIRLAILTKLDTHQLTENTTQLLRILTILKKTYDETNSGKLPEPTEAQQLYDKWSNEEEDTNLPDALENIKTYIEKSSLNAKQYEYLIESISNLTKELYGEDILRRAQHDIAELSSRAKKTQRIKGGKSRRRRRHRTTKRRSHRRRKHVS
jgi:hypothetical protein